MPVLFQSWIFSHPVVHFSALVLEAYLLKIMQSHASCYIVVFCISAPVRSYKLVTEAKHCIRQSALQAGPNAILYSYIAELVYYY